ncbi:MAG: hypothetical protein ACYDDZ_11090 [Acidimicrobiales bacterium]
MSRVETGWILLGGGIAILALVAVYLWAGGSLFAHVIVLLVLGVVAFGAGVVELVANIHW